jgi:CheY-like chemotaxis protein
MTNSEYPQCRRELSVLFIGTPEINIREAVRASCRCPVTVDVVSDGREAIQYLTEASETTTDRGSPDLILLEFGFESPDGETLLYAIKSSPRLETVPVVVLTADEIDTGAAYEYTGTAHVATPMSQEAYAELVRSIGQFWFEWVRYPSESLFTEGT